ncbi:MAG: hypothetical protein V4717_05655 [Bacteroidota bacterium]
MIKLLALCLSSLLCVTLAAQKNQYKGSYISTNGDVVTGIVMNFSKWDQSPVKILFKKDSDQSEILLTPVNSRQVSIDGLEKYIAFTGTRATSPTMLKSFGNESDTTFRFDTASIFLKELFNSAGYKLALFKDSKRENFYVIQTDRQPEELLFRVNTDQNGLTQINSFRQQLLNMLADSIAVNKKLMEQIAATNYTEQDLTKLFQRLSPAITNNNKKEQSGEFIILGGASFNSFKITPQNTSYTFANTDYNTSVSPVIALGYMFYLNRRFSSIFLSPQIRYYYTKHSGTQINQLTSATHNNSFQSSFLNFSLFIGKNWIDNTKLKWYTSAGPGLNAQINYKHTEYIDGTLEDKTITDNESSRLRTSVIFQTGILMNNKYGGWISYKIPQNLGYYTLFKTPLSSIQAGLEFRF